MNQRNCNNNTEVFFELVRAGLWPNDNARSTLSLGSSKNLNHNYEFDGVDWELVYQRAEEQSVVGFLAAGMETLGDNLSVPLELKLQILGEALQIEQQNKDMNAFVAKLIENMRHKGIYAILVKGQGIAQCYERPLWRSSGDVDLLLSDDNYEKAKEQLMPLAETMEKEYVREKHLGMTIDDWVVELHGHLYCGLSSRIEKELDEVRRDTFYGGAVRSWDNNGVQVFLLKAENDAFYVFTHILQHFYKDGVGLRQICDWCRLLYTYREKLDLRVLESRIKRAGLMSEWKALGAFAVEYLGMPEDAMPLYSDVSCWKRKARRILDFILMSGNMGHNREKSYGQYPFLIKKAYSMGRRLSDVVNHVRIFPLDSMRFSFAIMKNGITSALRGEG